MYLGVILDNGLTWKKQLDKVIDKAYKAFWTCRGTFGKTWELKPKVVYRIYTVMVRPTVTYAAITWWPRVKLKTSKAKLCKLQRSNENSSNSCNGCPPWTPPPCTCRWKQRPR
jgi:hypothetical protein